MLAPNNWPRSVLASSFSFHTWGMAGWQFRMLSSYIAGLHTNIINVQKLEDWKASHLTKATAIDPNYSLPLNVALITLQVSVLTRCRINWVFDSLSCSLTLMLQELDDGSVLLRLAHLYEVKDKKHQAPLCNPIDVNQVPCQPITAVSKSAAIGFLW